MPTKAPVTKKNELEHASGACGVVTPYTGTPAGSSHESWPEPCPVGKKELATRRVHLRVFLGTMMQLARDCGQRRIRLRRGRGRAIPQRRKVGIRPSHAPHSSSAANGLRIANPNHTSGTMARTYGSVGSELACEKAQPVSNLQSLCKRRCVPRNLTGCIEAQYESCSSTEEMLGTQCQKSTRLPLQVDWRPQSRRGGC